MKFVVGVSSLVGLTFASFAQMEADLRELSANVTDRAVTNMMGAGLAAINNYGCWCYFEQDHGKGKSQPVNDVDSFCQILHQGYDCVMMDAEDENDDDCIPWEIDYNSAPQSFDMLNQECQERNVGNNCAIRACIVENSFVMNIFQTFLLGNQHSATYLHSNGFDTEANCPTTKGQASEKACCGWYPERRPFKTYGGNRGCCGHKTYEMSVLTCCPGDKVRLACD